MNIRDSYRFRRMALNLTQSELAVLSGTSTASVNKFETGRDVSDEIFRKIKTTVDMEYAKLDIIEQNKRKLLANAFCLCEEKNPLKALKTACYISIGVAHLISDMTVKAEADSKL